MASYTTNLNLKKPAGSENVAIGDINGNMDTIDTAYGALNSKIAKNQVLDFATVINNRSSFSSSYNFCYKANELVQLDIDVGSNADTSQPFLKLIDSIKPNRTVYFTALNFTDKTIVCGDIMDGQVCIYNMQSGKEYTIHVMYFV